MSAFVLICHTSCLLKFSHQTLNCPSIRYIVPAKIFPALPLYQKNWFCGKVRFDYFYPLLRSTPSPWTHIGVKKISQACYLHHLKNMEKNWKTQFWDEKQIGYFFWTTLYLVTKNIHSLSTSTYVLLYSVTAWNVSVFGVILVRIFPHSVQM